MLKMRFWGTRGSIPSPGKRTVKYGGNTSCVEIRHGDHILIFDAGTGIRDLGAQLIKEFKTKPVTLHIFITHTHWDHIQGFPFFLPAYKNNFRIILYGPPVHNKTLRDLMKMQMDPEYFPVPLGNLNAAIEVMDVYEPIHIDTLTIQPFYVNHPTVTYAYKIIDGAKSIIYASDNEPYVFTTHEVRKEAVAGMTPEILDQQFVDFLTGTNLLICEAQYTKDEYKEKVGWGHSPVESVVGFAARAKIKNLIITHHDPTHEDAAIDRMIKQAQRLFKAQGAKTKCSAAREGFQCSL